MAKQGDGCSTVASAPMGWFPPYTSRLKSSSTLPASASQSVVPMCNISQARFCLLSWFHVEQGDTAKTVQVQYMNDNQSRRHCHALDGSEAIPVA